MILLESGLGMDASPAPVGTGAAVTDHATPRHVTVGIRAPVRGLVIAINLNPSRRCNFDCAYCPADRRGARPVAGLGVSRLAAELKAALGEVRDGAIRFRPGFRQVPAELLALRQVWLEGDSEPTLAPEFQEVVEAVIHLRALRGGPQFPLVLRTNGSRLDTRPVQAALEYFTRADEIWIKLDAGTQEGMNRVNRPDCTLERVLANIAQVARRRRVVIQTNFTRLGGQGPAPAELAAYLGRLQALRAAGAHVAGVWLHSTGGRGGAPACQPIPLGQLSDLARQVRAATGLPVEIY